MLENKEKPLQHLEESRKSLCRLDSEWTRTDEGYLDANVYPTRVGVFVYRDSSGKTIRELRLPEEVFDSESLKSLAGKAVTNGHPPQLLDTTNTVRYQKGIVKDFHDKAPDGIHTHTAVRIYDSDTIKEILSGKQEVSCGYTCIVKDESGVHPIYGPYDKIQTKIRHNHLAIEWRGRAGRDARLRVDSDVIRFDAEEIQEGIQEEVEMVKIKINGHEVEVSEAAKVAFDAYEQTKSDEIKNLNAAIEQYKADADTVRAERDAMKAKMDAAPDLDSIVEDRVKARTALLHDAALIAPDVKTDGLTDRELKEAVIKAQKWAQDYKLDGESDSYIDGLFNAAKSMTNTVSPVAAAIDKVNFDNAEKQDAAADAYQKMVEKKANAWKKVN